MRSADKFRHLGYGDSTDRWTALQCRFCRHSRAAAECAMARLVPVSFEGRLRDQIDKEERAIANLLKCDNEFIATDR